MNALLLILHPRRLPECEEAFRALPVDRLWVSRMSEREIVRRWDEIFGYADGYDHLLVCSDDVIVRPSALAAVLGLLEEGHPVVTGYCNLDRSRHFRKVNLDADSPSPVKEAWMWFADALRYPSAAIPTKFAGLCLTGMPVEMWRRFPFETTAGGHCSDVSLSVRLDEAGVPVVAAREGFCFHTKELWNHSDVEPGRGLLIGVEPVSITLDLVQPVP